MSSTIFRSLYKMSFLLYRAIYSSQCVYEMLMRNRTDKKEMCSVSYGRRLTPLTSCNFKTHIPPFYSWLGLKLTL
jgi:hypothetical protein